ncbi:Glutamine synthetase [Operophtera brumata]|uniref:glutamine synthetase n=1 Tax=Operophtera brumata TaxID=104452 RepID=A0A0L7KZK1_OPEBR|nr:Glutamine synthetase [Operophtera brumata]
MNSTPIALNKAAMRKYEDLEVPCDAILASYVWVDGTRIHLRSKDRTLNFVPKTNKEFFLTTTDARPLGWPVGGFPAPPGPYYCAIGADKINVTLFILLFILVQSGWKLGTYNQICIFLSLSKVGPSPGITSADDLWMARYILARLAEEYGTVASFEPQPVANWPGNGTFTYFSSKDMRETDGILVIERAIDKLARRHGAHINEYDANDGADNARRLTGKNNMPHIRDFTAGVANRSCCVRIPRQVSEDKKGYLEDRRPAANADPYRVICIMLKTCLFDE